MAVTASTILSRVRTQLIDNGATQRWSDAELMQWIADGCRTITAAVPSSSFVTSVVSLVAGTLQLIPSNGHMLLAVTRNFDATGLIPGRAIRLVPRDVLDSTLPDWHSTTASPQVQNYVFDPTMPEQYYVYPPNNGLGKAEITYAVAVADFTDPATVLPVQIYLWANSPEKAFVERTSAAILILLCILLLMNAAAVLLRHKFERRW